MLNPTTNSGAGPCFEGQTQRGAYFSGKGAHVIISKYISLMKPSGGEAYRGIFNDCISPSAVVSDGKL